MNINETWDSPNARVGFCQASNKGNCMEAPRIVIIRVGEREREKDKLLLRTSRLIESTTCFDVRLLKHTNDIYVYTKKKYFPLNCQTTFNMKNIPIYILMHALIRRMQLKLNVESLNKL